MTSFTTTSDPGCAGYSVTISVCFCTVCATVQIHTFGRVLTYYCEQTVYTKHVILFLFQAQLLFQNLLYISMN